MEEINKSIVDEIAGLVEGEISIDPLKVRSIVWDCDSNQMLINAVIYDCKLSRFDTCCGMLKALNFDRSNAGGGVYRVEIILSEHAFPEAEVNIQWKQKG